MGEVPAPAARPASASPAPASLVIERHDPQEPIAAALRKQWRRLTDWWISARMSAPAKTLILVAAIVVVLLNSQWLVPLLVCAGIVYFPYYAGRAVWLGLDEWRLTSSTETPEELETRVRAAVIPLGGSAAVPGAVASNRRDA